MGLDWITASTRQGAPQRGQWRRSTTPTVAIRTLENDREAKTPKPDSHYTARPAQPREENEQMKRPQERSQEEARNDPGGKMRGQVPARKWARSRLRAGCSPTTAANGDRRGAMKVPQGLQPLVEDGVVDTVIRQLQSGKEAEVYIVVCGEEIRCAKVYKSSEHRSFKKVAEYREGRKSRGSRNTRATAKRGRHGRKLKEEEWKTAEIDALNVLAAAGVRVPKPHGVHDGVLLMELVQDEDGNPAPRLNEVEITAQQARDWHAFLIAEIVRMLCAGRIHGDLSEFNVLVDPAGPVIIDLPQAVDASSNNNAFRMLDRDVNNMRWTFSRAAPELLDTQYAREMWDLYTSGELRPDTALTGRYARSETNADVDAVLDAIEEARREAEARALGREEAALG